MQNIPLARVSEGAPTSAESTQEFVRLELEKVRGAYHALIEAIPAEFWEAPSTNPAWNIRELAWHIMYAVKMMPADLGVLLRMKRQVPLPPEWLFHLLNRWATRWGARNLTPESAGVQYDQAHAHLLELLAGIPEPDFERSLRYPSWDPNLTGMVSVRRLFHYPYMHFEEHARQIDASLAALGVQLRNLAPGLVEFLNEISA